MANFPMSPWHKKSQSATQRYYEYLDKGKRVHFDDEEEWNRRKGDDSALAFEGELSDEENNYLISGEEDEKASKYVSKSKRKLLLALICLFLSFVLNFLQIFITNTPSIVKIDFSAFPELLAALAVNPIVAVIIILIKNFFYYLINQSAIASIPSKIILDSFYVCVTWLIAFILMKTKHYKKHILKREEQNLPQRPFSPSAITISGVISSAATASLSVVTLVKVTLPLLYRFFGEEGTIGNFGYTPENIFKTYQIAYKGLVKALPFVEKLVPAMNDLNTGIILYNIPLNIFKYFACAILALIAYLLTNNFINREK